MREVHSLVPLFVVALPLIGVGFVTWSARFGTAARGGMVNLISLGTVLLTVWQFLLVQSGQILVYALRWDMGFTVQLKVDFLSATFAVVVALVWFLAGVFGEEYMAHEAKQTRFFAASIFTLSATLGVFLAGNLLTFFLFFELMTFAAYLLVIHEESAVALSAGNVYLFMGVIGGLFLLGVMFVMQSQVGHTNLVPILQDVVEAGFNPWSLFVVVILALGVKAGMVPLHIWLPKAHPVAPAPASALLSALMIKTGAYGFIRFFHVVFTAPGNASLFGIQEGFGYAFIWIGAVTMFIGGLMALIHTPMKRVLAYSSISQMGYILFSLGVGVMLGTEGAVGLAGALMHMINHAFFKSFLFLLAGAIFLQTGELDLNRLGGLRKQMPVALGFFLVAAFSITGVPGLNGYVSKVMIHEAILHAYHVKGWISLLWLERTFVLTGGLTAAYISKIWLKTFFGKPKGDWSQVHDLSSTQRGVFTVYALILLGIGVTGQTRVNQLVLPALGITQFNLSDLEHLRHIPFWGLHELQSPLISYTIAAVVLTLQALLGPSIKIPSWWSVEVLVYRPVFRSAKAVIWLLNEMGMWFQSRPTNHRPRPKRATSPRTFSPLIWLTNHTSLAFDTIIMVLISLLLLVALFALR